MKQITFKHRGTKLFMTIFLYDYHSSCTYDLGDGVKCQANNVKMRKVRTCFPESEKERTITVTGDVFQITMHKKTKFSERSEFVIKEI